VRERRDNKEFFEPLQNQYSFDCINFYQPFSAFNIIRSPASDSAIILSSGGRCFSSMQAFTEAHYTREKDVISIEELKELG
jgi:hypothetical protein